MGLDLRKHAQDNFSLNFKTELEAEADRFDGRRVVPKSFNVIYFLELNGKMNQVIPKLCHKTVGNW